MLIGLIEQTDEDVLDYDPDLSRWLDDGETAASFTATIEASSVDPTTLVATDEGISDDRIKVRVSGGVPGESAYLKLLVTTSAGRVKELNYRVRIRER